MDLADVFTVVFIVPGVAVTAQGLNALVTRPDPAPPHWQQTMDHLPIDPWGQPYHYECPGRHYPASFDVYSAGPDRTPDTADDIGNFTHPFNY